MEPNAQYKRSKGIIDAKFQTHYLAVWLVVTLSLLFCCGGMYMYLRIAHGPKMSSAAGQAMDHFVLANFIFIFLLSALMGLYAVLHQHRVAGPAYRIRESLKRILHEDYSFTITLRKGDYLLDIALQLNQMIAWLRERDERLVALKGEYEKLRSAAEAGGTEEMKALVQKVGGLVQGLAVPPPQSYAGSGEGVITATPAAAATPGAPARIG